MWTTLFLGFIATGWDHLTAPRHWCEREMTYVLLYHWTLRLMLFRWLSHYMKDKYLENLPKTVTYKTKKTTVGRESMWLFADIVPKVILQGMWQRHKLSLVGSQAHLTVFLSLVLWFHISDLDSWPISNTVLHNINCGCSCVFFWLNKQLFLCPNY